MTFWGYLVACYRHAFKRTPDVLGEIMWRIGFLDVEEGGFYSDGRWRWAFWRPWRYSISDHVVEMGLAARMRSLWTERRWIFARERR